MTTWDVFWLLFVFVPLTILWIVVLMDMMGRRDLLGWQKAIWVVVIIFFPWVGILAYFVVRPAEAAFPATAARPAPAAQANTPRGSPTAAPTQAPGGTPAPQS
jgi:hypothetical protein